MKKINFTITKNADLPDIVYHLVRMYPCRVFLTNTLVDKLKTTYLSEFSEENEDLEIHISEKTVFKIIPSYIHKEFFCIDDIIGIDNRLSSEPEISYFISDWDKTK